VHVEAYHNEQGNFQGLRFFAGEHKFKASEIDRSLSKHNLEHTLEQHVAIEQNRSNEMSMRINSL